MPSPASPRPALSPAGFRCRLRRGALVVPLLLAAAASGCISQKSAEPAITGSIAKPVTADDFEKAIAFWEPRYAKNPKDRTAALNYAAALRRVGRTDQAVAILERAAIYNPDDREVLAAYGKALADKGDLPRALEIVRRAQRPDRPDWRLMSAEAAILDQLGQNVPARQLYAAALQIAPNEPSILSNLGMSHLIAGDLKEAEKYLRQAAAMPGADSRVRQNLALVVGLQGRFEEAETIAGQELSPEQAQANIAYLRSMLSQQNAWNQLKDDDKKKKTN